VSFDEVLSRVSDLIRRSGVEDAEPLLRELEKLLANRRERCTNRCTNRVSNSYRAEKARCGLEWGHEGACIAGWEK
jgi:hypothetical protein